MVPDRSPSNTAVSWVFGGLSVPMVAVRLYTRIFVTRQRGWDDFWIVVSLATAVICSALVEVGIHYGLGRHTSDIPDPKTRVQAAKYTVIPSCFSMASTTTGKLSVAVFLLRLLGQSATNAQGWSLYILSVVSISWNTICVIAVGGFCRPSEKIWRPEVPGSCFSVDFQLVVGTSQASFNAFADLFLAMFPIWIFYKVQLARVKKIGILVILGAGIFAAAATLTKCILLKSLPEHADITWSWAPITTWYTYDSRCLVLHTYTYPSHDHTTNRMRTDRSGYYDSSSGDGPSGKSGGSKNTPIRLQRMDPNASLFETVAERPRRSQTGQSETSGASQENILEHQRLDIKKTTEVSVTQDTRPVVCDEEERYFLRENPFRDGSSEGVSGVRSPPPA
ncbi:hypothetical protein BJY01DRAFT_262874 [Aspergillus pseudoustus]|uniref:Rhodopsin domain-containing protein n=1 Tax=Aspergillus pseudoustus TaxID=1810923 RepID=A0ABR4K7Q2_9EURO